jgi:hypothetical protein
MPRHLLWSPSVISVSLYIRSCRQIHGKDLYGWVLKMGRKIYVLHVCVCVCAYSAQTQIQNEESRVLATSHNPSNTTQYNKTQFPIFPMMRIAPIGKDGTDHVWAS